MYNLDLFLKMPRKVQELFWSDVESIIDNELSWKPDMKTVLSRYQFDSLASCESPIEQILLANFDRRFRTPENFYDYGYFLYPQITINCGKKTYRADFLAIFSEMVFENDEPHEVNKFILVECDGHDFHEKSKKQVKVRNDRDYDLKMHGFDIVHFSGSEIFNDPEQCVDKIKNLLDVRTEDDMSLLENTGMVDIYASWERE